MKKRLLRILACALLLSGSSAIHAADPIRVACVGNSITAGSGISDAGQHYPSQLQNILGSEYKVSNFGSSGATAQTISDANSYMKRDVYPKALAFNPDIVVIKLGTNDSKADFWTGPDRYKADMRTIINSFRDLESNPKIYLCLPLRTIKPDHGILEKNIHKIIPAIYELGEEYDIPVINLHTVMEDSLGTEWESAYGDGVHPNAIGAGIMAKRIAKALLDGDYGTYDPSHTPRKTQIVSCIGGTRLKTGVNSDEYYPAVIQSLSGGTLSTVNAGVVNRTILRSGKESATATVTCGYIDHNDFTNNVLNKAPDIVTIDLGEKDTPEWNWANKADIEKDLTDMVEAIRQTNASVKIYVCLPTRTKGDRNTSNIRGSVLREELYPILKEMATKLNVDVINTASAVDAANYLTDGYRFKAEGHRQMADMIYSALTGTYTDPGNGDGNNPVGGNNSGAEKPADAEYYTIAENPAEKTGSCINPNSSDPWWAYNEMGITNTSFSLEGCDTGNLYLELDMYAENPDVAPGEPAFPGITWGKILPSDEAHGNQPQHYFFVKMKKPATATTERYEWNFTNMNEEMNDVFGAMLSDVKSGEWNHLEIPFSNSPYIDNLPLDGGYTNAGVSFARMQKNNYIFKTKNVKLVDRSRYYANKTIETGYAFVQPANAGDEASFVLGGEAKTSAFMKLDFNMTPEISDPANTSLCFDAEISSVDGTDDPALLGNITGPGGHGIYLASCTANEIQQASSRANYPNIKALDWQFGKHTYTLPLASFKLNGGMTWDEAPIASCWMYIYDDVLTLGKINLRISNFRFVKRELVEDNDDDTTSIDDVELATEDGDATVTIYNLYGVQVYSGIYSEAQLPAGLYVVVGANGSRKVLF